jgi:hypothetical protein
MNIRSSQISDNHALATPLKLRAGLKMYTYDRDHNDIVALQFTTYRPIMDSGSVELISSFKCGRFNFDLTATK